MKHALMFAILLLTGSSSAQSPINDWQNVRRLLGGEDIIVTGPSSKVNCTFVKANDDDMECAPVVHRLRRSAPPDVVIPRVVIREVRLVHSEDEERSSGTRGGAIAGGIIGVVGGIAGGPPRLARVLIAAPLLVAIGAGIGGLTHPLGSTVIYRSTPVNRKRSAYSKAKQINDRSAR